MAAFFEALWALIVFMANHHPLNQSPLFRLRTRRRLACSVIGMPLSRVEKMASQGDAYRHCVRVTGGKERAVDVPEPALRDVHARLATLLNRIEVPSYLHSGQKGLSHLTNALTHAASVRVAKLDIRHFYPSITRDRIWRCFVSTFQCSGDVAALVAKLCTHRGSTPIGSPVSQVLAYHVVRPMLDELQRMAQGEGIRFSCYVDDLSFSGERADHEFLAAASAVVRRHGFVPHAEHCYGTDEDRLITGVLLTAQGPRVPQKQLAKLQESREGLAAVEGGIARLNALQRLVGVLAAAAAIDKSFLDELEVRRNEWKTLWLLCKGKSASAASASPRRLSAARLVAEDARKARSLR